MTPARIAVAISGRSGSAEAERDGANFINSNIMQPMTAHPNGTNRQFPLSITKPVSRGKVMKMAGTMAPRKAKAVARCPLSKT